eukprot:2736921-Lingulodinium_polyedra.AAC.1
METLRALIRRGPMQGPISVGGDVNVCIAQPKNEQEADIVATLMSLFTMWGVDHLPQMAPHSLR